MRMKFLFPLALALALTSACQTLSPTPAPDPQPVEDGEGYAHGPGYAYGVTAPPGWVLYNDAMPDRDIPIMVHRAGQARGEVRFFIYTAFSYYSEDEANNLDTPAKLAEWNLKNFRERQNARASAKRVGEIRADSGWRGEIWSFEIQRPAPQLPQFERVVYFPAPTGIVIIVASAMNETLLEADLGALEKLARSYRWLGRLKAAPEN